MGCRPGTETLSLERTSYRVYSESGEEWSIKGTRVSCPNVSRPPRLERSSNPGGTGVDTLSLLWDRTGEVVSHGFDISRRRHGCPQKSRVL